MENQIQTTENDIKVYEPIIVSTPTIGESNFGKVQIWPDGTASLSTNDWRVKTVDDLVEVSKLIATTLTAANKAL
jgi:hypothetical protein